MLYEQSLLKESNKLSRQVSLRVSEKVVNKLEEGMGVAFDISGYGNSLNCFPPLEDKEHWRLMLDGLMELGIRWMRLRIPMDKMLLDNGEINKNAEVIERLKLFHELALRKDINIVIALNPTNLWGDDEITRGHSPAPRNLQDYANSLVLVLEYLIKIRCFSKIKYVTIYDEPFNEDGEDFTFAVPKDIDPWEYCFKMYKIVKELFISRDLPIKLMGPASADVYRRTIQEFFKRGLDLSAYVDAFDSHIYRYRLAYLPPSHHIPTLPVSDVVRRYIAEDVAFARKSGKPFFLSELGCMYYGKSKFGDNRGPSRHESFIAESALIVQSLNAGVDGFLKWAYLFNPAGEYGYYQLINTFDNSFSKQPNYYGYAVLSRHFPKNANVLSVEPLSSEGNAVEFLAYAILEKDSRPTVFLVNSHPAEILGVEINFEKKMSGIFIKWVNDVWDKNSNKGEIHANENRLSVQIPPMSLVVISSAMD